LTAEIHDLESKVAISRVPAGSDAGFVSPMFVVPKSDRTWRPVINLKALNNYISCPHFKMESIRTAKDLIRQGDWLQKLDLKDAYLTVPIHHSYQKYLRFQWKSQIWQFQVLPSALL
jgi:hypothetical protein